MGRGWRGALSLLLPRGILHFLHISKLLFHMTGRPGHGYNEIEHEPVQQVKYDRQKKYFR
jgi:hypothetical protein